MADRSLQRPLTALFLALVLSGAAFGQASTADEESFFGDTAGGPGSGGSPAAAGPVAGESESDFFDSGSAETTGTTAGTNYQESFVKASPIQFGGNFKLVMKTGLDYYRDFNQWTPEYFFGLTNVEVPSAGYPSHLTDKVENSSIDLQGSLFFSARPTSGLRLFGKAKVAFPFTTAVSGFISSTPGPTDTFFSVASSSLKIWELFADFNINETVFVRAGKQMVKWGANPYAFWSPADVITLGSIDINDRGAELEGPLAIKANIPFGDHNLDFYVLAPGNENIRSITDMGAAMRAKFLVGSWELGAGVLYQKTQDIKFVATASGSLWKFGIFGEALVNRTSNNFYIKDNAIGSPRADWFFSGTAGISYANADIFLDTVMLQYYFNGMGTSDMASAANSLRTYVGINPVKAATVLGKTAASWTGMHYMAITAQESFVNDSKVHFLTTWLANLSDGSGFVSPGLNIDITDEIILGITFSVYYGNQDTQFIGIAGIPGFQRPRFNMGLSLSLGTGNF